MLQQKRFDEILKLVNEKGSATVQELTERLNASEATVRRDLTTLNDSKKLNKVHGGATSLDMYYTKDENVELRKNQHRDEKQAIVEYAAKLIKPTDFVYIDAGTTTEMLIDYITEKNAVYVTNAINHVKKLAEKGFEAHIIGGKFKVATEAIVGQETLLELNKYNFSIGFWGTNGISQKHGFSTPDIGEAMVKRKAMEQCKERYVLGDQEKFNVISSVSFGDFKSATIITTEINEASYKKCDNIIEVYKMNSTR